MYHITKSLICSVVYLTRQEQTKMTLSLSRLLNPRVLLLKNNCLLFTSSNTMKENSNVPLKLSHQAFAVPYKSEESVPIIILHGLLGSKSNWNSIAKALMTNTDNRMVITLDARNHGDSPHTDQFSYELMVSDLRKFLNDKSIEKASLIGHSMGGRTCMLFALKYPALVQSLIVVDISPVGHSPSMIELPKLFNIIKGLEIDPYLSLSEARKLASAQLKEHKVDEKLISFLMTNLVSSEGLSNWRWKFNVNSISRNFKSEICEFPVHNSTCSKPTLFVAGGNSDYIRKEDESKITSVFPMSTFEYIAGAGHWVHADKPQQFITVVTNFLNSVKS